ncbi:hypothetical protein CYMTET_4990 [Cymbomonas tetramitiformis]|uniref:Uncharacterized protein n=1 Tax=Cymbomonas tetramitiformis TaxID=36881 RepID=A0AAE0H0A6_9CHLO|nr:hypothetical protein CYMTET_4990 [Cymbomonas tetramitiformis]
MRYWTQMRAIVLSETVDPAPQLATIRRLCERHRKVKPAYGDSDRVADLWHILAESAKKSPYYVTPLYLVVLRELRSGHAFTFDRLALRIRLAAFGTKAPLPHFRPSRNPALGLAPPATAPRPRLRSPRLLTPPAALPPWRSARRNSRRRRLMGSGWVADSPTALYKKWSGTGYPCAMWFRMWGVTDAHSGTRGACPYYACIEAFANDKHLESSKPAAPRPSLHPAPAGKASDSRPAGNASAPSADSDLGPAFQSVRLQLPAPGGANMIDPVDAAAPVVPMEDSAAPPLLDEHVGASLAFQDEDTDLPPFRSSPVWVPHVAGADDVIGIQPQTLD